LDAFDLPLEGASVAVRIPPGARKIVAALAVAVAAGTTFLVAMPSSAAEAPPPAAEVWTRQSNADGSTTMSVYQAPGGITSSSLYQSLRNAGVAGLVDPATAPPTIAAAATCTYTSANTLTCPPVRWDRKHFGDPQVYFRDSSSSAWPVSAAVTDWNSGVGADVYYIWHLSGGCPGVSTGKHCVSVASASYTWNAALRVSWISDSGYFRDGSVKVELNNRYSSSADNRALACRGIGKALGVGNNTTRSSCMYPQAVDGPDYGSPHSSDRNLIRYVLYPD
jgi:hypothetical protein